MWERLVRNSSVRLQPDLVRVRLQPDRETIMEKDVVCGMQVDPAKAAATSEYKGKTYYFCAKVCKTKFDANPGQYVKN